MARVNACEFPEHLWFNVEEDTWVEPLPDGTVRVGMTDPAQTRAGRLLTIGVRVGKHVARGRNLATVESGKWVGPVPSPLPGTILAANPQVLADPNLINRDPYREGWLVVLRPDAEATEWRALGLVPGPEAVEPYRVKLEAARLLCLRCVQTPAETAPHGGEGTA
ncbi:Glycine cleavage system H protein 3 [Candidatus Hydrogenisulfobacillus filiaventi]|uniref:Glycine cleavage system H protein 3 n=1 Tax=Candidatus Hydrogenisulfobacillus filiaventi TaxID=2707344 RepID=A0A6F8ZFX4_9FIRM|nr:glycine cleavage system protein H [Bacillota bacterium]CAB1128680.1 Glycine cleavage system H protein 3 [Candidatus Hydrogenisulfobacillus filiaventi]